MTMTDGEREEYDHRLSQMSAETAAIKQDLHELQIRLFGDLQARELYARNRETNTAPNIPEPVPGIIESLLNTITVVERTWSEQYGTLASSLRWARKLEQFFSPIISSPETVELDVRHIATKDYVDTGLERLSKALRGEFLDKYGEIRDFVIALKRSPVGVLDPARDNAASTWWTETVRRLSWTWARENHRAELEAEKAKRPSRMQSLIHAVTGYTKTNGASR